MKKLWKDIKVGDVMKDGSIVTQVHRTHEQEACKIIYDYNKEFICSYNHILLIDVSELPAFALIELDRYCTFIPLEENYDISCDDPLNNYEKLVIDQFCHNENINVQVDVIEDSAEIEIYDFHFEKVKRVCIKNVILKSEPQKVNDHTYWLTCKGIEYLMKQYNATLYCNGYIINKIEPLGKLPCFCISTNTGKYET